MDSIYLIHTAKSYNVKEVHFILKCRYNDDFSEEMLYGSFLNNLWFRMHLNIFELVFTWL